MRNKKFEQKLKSYKKFLEAFNSKFSSKFFLPEELKNLENYISTKKYKFKCKRCGYENEIEARRFIRAFREDKDIRCKGCEESKNAIEFKLKELKLDKYIKIKEYTGTNRTILELTCKHGTKNEIYWANFNKFVNSNKKYFEELGEWIFPNICSECKKEYIEKIKKKEFFEKFKKYETEGVKILWDESDYSNMYSKVVLFCSKHGRFETQWISIYNSQGKYLCRKCYFEELKKIKYEERKYSVKDFQELLDKIHSARLIEILEEKDKKISSGEKIKVKCLKHNYEYFAYPNNLIRGHKCPKCGAELSGEKQSKYQKREDLINELNSIYPPDILQKFEIPPQNSNLNKFPISAKDKITIKCNKHGLVKISIQSLRKGTYCPYCQTSSLEIKVLKFLREILPENTVIERNRRILDGLEIDIFLPEYNLGIETHGLYYHSLFLENRDKWNYLKNLHKTKVDLADEKGIILLQIFENELVNPKKWEIWKDIIKSKLGIISNKIGARELKIIDLTEEKEFVKEFLENNHIQGYIPYRYAFGLINPKTDEILSILTIGAPRFERQQKQNAYEILRFSTKLDNTISGAFSKLVKYAIKELKIKNLITFADRRYTSKNKNVYLSSKLFKLTKITRPNYYYFEKSKLWDIKNLKLFSRLKFQKHRLDRKIEKYINELSELENMLLLNDYGAIFDAGNLKFELNFDISF